MEQKDRTSTVNEKVLTIQRTFELPIADVWKAWSETECFKKWWGPKNYTCPECSIDFNIGGKYLASMKDKKDGKMMWSTGMYREIVPYRKIVMTDNFSDRDGNVITPAEAGIPGNWPQKELLITVELEEHYGKTNFSLRHEGLPAEMHDECKAGWQESFDKLEHVLLNSRITSH